jgi:hypothetical protein
MTNKRRFLIFVISYFKILLPVILLLFASCSQMEKPAPVPFSKTRTILNTAEKFGEPFGIVVRNGEVFFSDGETGKIWRVSNNQNFTVVTDKFHTPSQIAFDKNGDLIVADSGTHTIKRVKIPNGEVESIAGVENQNGYADGDAKTALFNAPVGVAVSGDKIYVADTYNDRIRVIENGKVSTAAGSERGFADSETSSSAKFDTPCGLAIWKDNVLVADLGNRRLRVIETNGRAWTLAGNGLDDSIDGLFNQASFVSPVAVSIDNFGVIYVADGNSIRAIGRRIFPFVETVTNTRRGFSDGNLRASRFNRPSGLASDEKGNLFVADADNQVVRVLSGAEIGIEISKVESEKMRISAEEFRRLSEPRWTYNPPERRREIAGTLGEIRGEIVDANSQAWFHNGLDIVGGYGETARFVRTEKVLLPLAVENYATSRELIRMPTLGYIHIRLGRDKDDSLFGDRRFIFSFDENRKANDLRVPRGAKFEAGDAVGTLNAMNHVHLIAGRSGAEMNALDALLFPGISDSIIPKIEKVSLFDENWNAIKDTVKSGDVIELNAKTRIVVLAYDRMDGNAERRRLGVYRVGYQILRADKTPLGDVDWTISFDRLPDYEAVKFVYAVGSKSGATGETIFNYIASNRVNGSEFREDFFDAGALENGDYILRVFAADFFGNMASEDISFTR